MSERSSAAGCAIVASGLLAAASAWPGAAPRAAEDVEVAPVVVTATRLPTSVQRLGSAVSVISREDIEASGERSVSALLRRVPGLTVVNSGGPGARTDVSIRGADEDQTLVLIDGVPVNDPATTGGRFDFAGLQASGVERIEVLRGPQSALYGSDAIGGVVNVITRRGSGAPGGYAGIEYGSFQTDAEQAGFGAGGARWDVAIDGARTASNGFSRVDGGAEDDGARVTSVSGRAGVSPLAPLRLEAVARVQDVHAELDPTTTTDGFADKDERRRSARLRAALTLAGGAWTQQLDVYGARTERRFRDPGLRSDFEGERVGAEYRHDVRLGEPLTLSLGGELRRDAAHARESAGGARARTRFDETQDTRSAYALAQSNLRDRLYVSLGARVDDFEDFGTEATWRLTAAVPVDATGTLLRASYGTGAKAPTLQQRFDRTFLFGFLPVQGNPALGVERSRGFDMGVEQGLLADRVTVSATLFRNTFDDLIEFDLGAGTFVQVDRAKSRGVEIGVDVEASDALGLRATWTWLDTEDASDGTELARRPAHRGTLTADLRASDRLSLQASVELVGRRFNRPGERERLAGYARVDLAGRYALGERLELRARVANLLDRDYEEAANLATAGRSLYVGLRARF